MSETYANMKIKIQRDLDTEDEQFVQEAELLAYFNDAIRECESQIHTLGLDNIYFLDYDNPSIVSGTSEYAMPTNIYLNKIVKCIYNDGNKVYEIREFKGRRRFEEKALIDNSNQSQPIYQYFIRNTSASAGPKWVLSPNPSETSSTRFTRWFIRKVAPLTGDASVCDVPDVCLNFIYAHVAWKIWGKEGDARAIDASNERKEQRQIMLETLAEMTPDNNDVIEMDFDIYDEIS